MMRQRMWLIKTLRRCVIGTDDCTCVDYVVFITIEKYHD